MDTTDLARAVEVLDEQSIRHRALDEARVLLARAAHIEAAHRGHAERLSADLVDALATGRLVAGTERARDHYAALLAAHVAEHPGVAALAAGRDPHTAAAHRCRREAFELLKLAGIHAGQIIRSRVRDGESNVAKLSKRLGGDADRPIDAGADRKTITVRLDLEDARRGAERARAALDELLDLGIVDREPGEQTDADRVREHFRAMASGQIRYTLGADAVERLTAPVPRGRNPLTDPSVIVAGLLG